MALDIISKCPKCGSALNHSSQDIKEELPPLKKWRESVRGTMNETENEILDMWIKGAVRPDTLPVDREYVYCSNDECPYTCYIEDLPNVANKTK